jgi:hypothetical protein
VLQIFGMLKNPSNDVEIAILWLNSSAISRPQFPVSLFGVSRVVVGVGASGGASGSFQSRARTVSLNCCGTYGGDSLRAQWKKKKKKKKEEEEKKKIVTKNLRQTYRFSSRCVVHICCVSASE